MLFFAGSGYSRQAVEYADEVGMALFVYDEIGIVAPHNGCAENLVNRAGRPVRVTDDPGEPDFYPDVDIAVAVELARSYRAEQHEIRVAEHLATREPVPPLIPVDVKSGVAESDFTHTGTEMKGTHRDPQLEDFGEFVHQNEMHGIGYVLQYIFTGRTSLRSDPGEVGRIVQKCTASVVSQRYEQVVEVIADIEGMEEADAVTA